MTVTKAYDEAEHGDGSTGTSKQIPSLDPFRGHMEAFKEPPIKDNRETGKELSGVVLGGIRIVTEVYSNVPERDAHILAFVVLKEDGAEALSMWNPFNQARLLVQRSHTESSNAYQKSVKKNKNDVRYPYTCRDWTYAV